MGLDVFANVGHVTLSGAVELMRGPGVLDGITYGYRKSGIPW